MTNQIRKDLMTLRDARIGKPSGHRLSNAIECVNRGDLHGAHMWVQAGQLCDSDNDYVHAHHANRPWAFVACIRFENHHQ